ncbi:MAG: ABC transporter substrate-binding protein [Lachnospiraceae bacterium]|nr:ABC transporter substrate-binding protein [Lachnospiraceae bacterium]
MKKYITMLVAASLITSVILCGCSASNEKKTLTVFNYGMYIDMNMIDQFQKETGIEVRYEEAPTPEELYTKYKSGAIDYDVLCTSEYMLQKLIDEGELMEIDFDSMENTKGIGSKYWDMVKSFDPDNKYVMPYFWGTVGLLYDSGKVPAPESWEVLFNGQYSGDIIMQNSMRDAYMIALKYLGYSLNSTDDKELAEAQELLIKQKPDVQSYLVDEVRDEILAQNAAIGVVYSGEAFYAYEENPDIKYCIPKEGSNLWIDCWGITKNCHDTESAKKFLDYLCREDVARANFEEVRYSSPITAIADNLTEEEQASDAMNPSADKLANCEIYKRLPDDVTEKLSTMWKELKAD